MNDKAQKLCYESLANELGELWKAILKSQEDMNDIKNSKK